MKTSTITDAKNRLSALIDVVKGGESVLITDRGRAVAMLEPIGSSADASGRVQRLQRAGMIRVGRGTVPSTLLRTAPPPLKRGSSGVEALLDERRSGR